MLTANPVALPSIDEVEWERKRRAEETLASYIRQAWPVVEPGTQYMHNWHIDAIADYLTAVDLGEILRLVVNLPPRNMKSTIVSVCWPTWTWIKHPTMRWLFASYAASLSTDHSTARRTIIDSPWYQENWGDKFYFAADQNQKTEYRNNHRGMMLSVGLQGAPLGKGGDRVVIDDPHDPIEAKSDKVRNTDIQSFNTKFATRLDDLKKGAIVIVMQRLHEKDLAGVCIEQGYVPLVLPAEAPKHTVISFPVSGREIVREQGDLLWPERQGPAELAIQKKALADDYEGQYGQDPSPADGAMFKKTWWRFWVPEGKLNYYPPITFDSGDGDPVECVQVELPAAFDEQAQSWDMTFKDNRSSDYVVGQIWGRKQVDAYLLDQTRGKYDINKTIEELLRVTAKWVKALAKYIEDKANGPAVMQLLRGKVAGLIAVNPEGGKVARANATVPLVRGGNVYLPHPKMPGYEWVWQLIDEFAKFPNGANDDMVDTGTQMLNKWGVKRGGGFF